MTSIMENMPQIFSHQDLITIISEFPIILGAGPSGEVRQRRFPNGTLLGAGGYGEVYKGRLPNGMEVAVKVLLENGTRVKETFTAEAKTMFTATHQNLIKLYGFCFEDDMKALVYELMEGSLDMILYENDTNNIENQNNLPKIEWAKLYDITIGIAEGLSYLHEGCHQRIIHHDVKPANVLLDLNGSPKLTDFGVAKHMSRDLSHFTGTAVRGTRGFIAPEVGMGCSHITYTCDVYSYGKMLFEVLARKRNSENQTEDKEFPEQVWDRYKDGHLEEMIINCGITGDDIEKARILSMVGFWCIQFTPEARPTMRTVINWLQKVIPVLEPSNPFYPSPPSSLDESLSFPVTAGATPSLPPTPDESMFMKGRLLLGKLVPRFFSKDQPQELPSLQLYMEKLLEGPPETRYHQLRMHKRVFVELCELFRQKRWLQNTEFTVEEKIAMFLMKTNRRLLCGFQISGQQRNKCFHEVLRAMLKFSKEMIVSSNYNAPVGEINHCRRLREGAFRGAVGALDGTLFYPTMGPTRNCNVLGVCDFEMKFEYVLVTSEGVAHDSRMLDEALRHPSNKFPLPPQDKYYLYDSLYTHSAGFLCPHRNTRYRLQDFRHGGPIINKEEAFNHAHAQLRNVIERAFGVLKERFLILGEPVPPRDGEKYGIVTEERKNIVSACMAIHNFVRQKSRGDGLFRKWESDDILLTNKQRLDPIKVNELPGEELVDMVNLREEITNELIRNASYSYLL